MQVGAYSVGFAAEGGQPGRQVARQGNLLRPKSFEVGLLAKHHVGQSHPDAGVEVVGEHDGLLLIDLPFRDCGGEEEVTFTDAAAGALHLRRGVGGSIMGLPLLCGSAGCTPHLDGEGLRAQHAAIGFDGGRPDAERPLSLRGEDEGIGHGRRGGGAPVDDLRAGEG